MSDTTTRNLGDSSSPIGYRPLPGSNNSTGPDLNTIVFATIGVALGIVVGTVCADGSWRSFVPGSGHQTVMASTTTAKASTPPTQTAAVAHQAPPVDDRTAAQRDLDQHPLPQRTLPPVSQGGGILIVAGPTQVPHPAPTPVQARTAPPVTAPEPLLAKATPAPAIPFHDTRPSATAASYAAKSGPAFLASRQPASQPAIQRAAAASHPTSQLSAPRQVSLAHRRRIDRRLALRRALWRKAHPHRRIPAYLFASYVRPRAAIPAPAPTPEVEHDSAPERFAFKVEGYTTVLSYNALAGTIQTYEGSIFILSKPVEVAAGPNWLDSATDLHYSCDQDWNCTLAHAGVEVATAHRAR